MVYNVILALLDTTLLLCISIFGNHHLYLYNPFYEGSESTDDRLFHLILLTIATLCSPEASSLSFTWNHALIASACKSQTARLGCTPCRVSHYYWDSFWYSISLNFIRSLFSYVITLHSLIQSCSIYTVVK